MAFAFPGMVESRLVADGVFAKAYDAVTPAERAVIKTGIARMAAFFGPVEGVETHSVTTLREGFCLHADSRRAPWAVVMWDGAYAGAMRVLAALVPAMLAGVTDILACRVGGGGAFPQPLLAAMELAGQELVADCSPEDAAEIAALCGAADTGGRLVLLGRNAAFDRIAAAALERGTDVRRYAAPVRIGIAASTFVTPSLDDTLRFVHPDAALVPFEGDAAQGNFSAVYCAENAVPQYLGRTPLVLCPGNEGFWRWPGVDRNFYRAQSLGIRDIEQV